ncbi:MAG: dinitrogenase iron-molybdenum cofactor biosynthesis protein [Thermoplasmata archaeon]|nr:MAG: dinitrogenase iron-molybdenum cofactor biosynthesis protein [Thermoplasmata archaeon]
MKVAVTSQTKSIDSIIDERFGRCNFFIIVEPDSMEYEVLPNEAIASSSGAGIKAAQELINKKVDAVITGNIGPNAFDILKQAGIKIFRAFGNVKEAIEKFKEKKLEEIRMANVGKHGGMI